MSGHAVFWFVAGVMSGAAACLLSLPIFRRLLELRRRRAAGLAVLGVLASVAGAAVVLYTVWGRPGEADRPAAHADVAVANAGGASTAAGSIDTATQKLAQRLKTQGGSGADWSLLAQSYEYLGRTSEAADARARAADIATGGAAGSGASATGGAAESGAIASVWGNTGVGVRATAGTAPSLANSPAARQLLAQAEKYRLARDYAGAADSYRQLADLHGMNADAWANYADAVASASDGRLQGPPEQFLQNALRLDPDHPKALWLQASLLHEQRRYAEARAVWEHLAATLPKDSPDAAIVAANVAEARNLATAAGAASVGSGARISGEVDIDPKLLAKAVAGASLFIFAKSVDSPGPPLAVLRTEVGRWPVRFSLSDSQAMLPQRALSNFRSVIVEARISGAGQPLAQRGDVEGRSGVIDPQSDKPVRVVINDVIAE